jgi:acetylornithine/N-succinyldiaminopimelate aminotransferase
LEPIQGEGGVKIPTQDYLVGLRKLADENGLLLIFDEVQTGCGRTGEWFGFQYFGVQPDIMTLAKSLCGGIAGGAMIARRDIAPSLRAGMHASTFGGNPIAAAAGIATLETIEADGLLAQAKANAAHFAEGLSDLAQQFPHIREVRQAGLMIGIELDFDGSEVVEACLNRGLLVNCTHSTVIRLLPAMNISAEQIDRGISILTDALTERVSTITQPESLAPST